jgi:hypothetical protein
VPLALGLQILLEDLLRHRGDSFTLKDCKITCCISKTRFSELKCINPMIPLERFSKIPPKNPRFRGKSVLLEQAVGLRCAR